MPTNDPINVYGDTVRSTTGEHGVDIASQRMDELDTECIRFLSDTQKTQFTVVDLGCGLGTQSLRMASLGAEVWMYDLMDISKAVDSFNAILPKKALHFVQKDISNLADVDLPTDVHLLYSQRFLHYLSFSSALKTLKMFRKKMTTGSKAFLSVSGLYSELGTGYSHAQLPIEKRYAQLKESMAKKHDIHAPVCLYTENDFIALLNEAGFDAVSVYTSPFGNIKGVFEYK